MGAKFCGKELLYALAIGNGALTFGYIIVYASPAIENMKNEYNYNISSFEETAFKSIISLAAIFGPFLLNYLLKFMGRKPAAFITGIFGAIFWALTPLMNNKIFWYGIIIRFFSGLAMGSYSTIVPLYIVELAPPGAEGFFGSFNQLFVSIGIVICYLIGNWTDWKVLAYCGIIFPSLLSLLVLFVPESEAGKKLRAARLAQKSGDLQTIDNSSEERNTESIFQKKFIPNLLVSMALMFFQQFCGVNGLLSNLTSLMDKAGLKISGNLASAISSVSQVFAVFLGSLFVDKIGPKAAWIGSLTGVAGSLFMYAFSLKYNWGNLFPLISVFLYLFFFGIGMGPIPWFIIPQLFPTSVRAIASSIGSATNWLCCFAVIFLFPVLQNSFGDFVTLLIFASIVVIGIIFSIVFMKNPSQAKQYEEIDNTLINNDNGSYY